MTTNTTRRNSASNFWRHPLCLVMAGVMLMGGAMAVACPNPQNGKDGNPPKNCSDGGTPDDPDKEPGCDDDKDCDSPNQCDPPPQADPKGVNGPAVTCKPISLRDGAVYSYEMRIKSVPSRQVSRVSERPIVSKSSGSSSGSGSGAYGMIILPSSYSDGLNLYGPTGSWHHNTTYNGNLGSAAGGGTPAAQQGSKWAATHEMQFVQESGNAALHIDAFSKRTFTLSGGVYTAPADFHATLTDDTGAKVFTLTMTDTGIVYKFNDFTVTDVNQRGILLSQTDRYGTQTISYSYNGSITRIDTVTTAQGWVVSYTYVSAGTNTGKVQQIDCKNGSSQVFKRVKYTYYSSGQGYHTDCGSDGDLLMEDALERASGDNLANSTDADFSIRHTKQYRYYKNGDTDGKDHLMKMAIDPAELERITGAGDTAVDDPAEILTKADSYAVNGSTTVAGYASRSFTYYTSNVSTNSVTTPWTSNENLESEYGGSNTTEADTTNNIYMVKSETVSGSCGSCGGGGNGGYKKTYFYMDLNGGSTAADTVVRITVEDMQDSAGAAVNRTIYGLNDAGYTLRKALIADPTQGTLTAWCKSYKLGTSGNELNQMKERRDPSAHTGVNSNTLMTKFLNPTSSTNDNDTLSASAGLVHVYTYTAEGYQADEQVKNGRSGTAYYVSAADYGDGTSAKPKRLKIATYQYPTQTSTRGDASRLETDYTYVFYDPLTAGVGDTKLQTLTTTYPTVGSGQNGSGVAVTTSEYRDTSGRLRWSKDGEGRITYYAYHPDTGGLAYMMVDVKTNSLPSDITSGSAGKWIDWTDNSGAAPTGFTYTGSDALQLVSKTEYDDLARVTKQIDPEGSTSYVIYKDNEVRYYKAWDSTAHKPIVPVEVTKVDDGFHMTQKYTVDPSGVTFSDPPTGGETLPQTAYATWKTFTYNAKDQLETVDTYHNIPSSGSGTLSTSFNRKFNRYDNQGRLDHVIEVVSGTLTSSSVEQVTKYVYDKRDRIIEMDQGVSGTGQDMGGSYTSDPTLKQVSAIFYDEATPGSGTAGVGDGLVTATIKYYDASSSSNNVKTIYHYNWHNFLRGLEPEAAPYIVQDVDFNGRVIAGAMFKANLTWSTVITTDDYAQNASNSDRGTLATTAYDQMNRVYQTAIKAVNSSGVVGNAVVTDSFYDRRSSLVATQTSGQGGMEYAYDGAGRKYQSRTVTALNSSKYSGGAFSYRAPTPDTTYGSMSGGNDKVVQLTHMVLDKVGMPQQTLVAMENHDDTDGLTMSATSDRIQTASFGWFDAAHRTTDTANYGSGDTNSGAGQWKYFAIPSRPGSAPSRSDSVLVTSYGYDNNGRLQTVTDPKALVTKTIYDNLGRTKYKIENYDNFNESTEANTGDGSDKSKDRVTKFTYNGLSQVVTQVAMDPNADGTLTDNETTTYLYEDAYHANLLTSTIYPDSTDTDSTGYDQTKYTYNLDSTPATRTAQKASGGDTATVIEFNYDATFHRMTSQGVATVGTGIDSSIKAVGRSYDNLGRPEKFTSYSAYASPNPSTVVNEVQLAYDDMGALTTDYQEHGAAVNTSTSLKTQYGYDSTNAGGVFTNGYRGTSITYPNGRVVDYLYLDAGGGGAGVSGISDALSRPTAIATNTTRGSSDANVIASYQYNGARMAILKDYPTPKVKLDLYGGTTGTYAGLDRQGRIASQDWVNYNSSPVDTIKVNHDYDRDSNRLWAEDTTYKSFSQKYTYDNLNRLTSEKRGQIKSDKSDIESFWLTQKEGWTLDALGNQTAVDELEASSWTTHTVASTHNANEYTERKVLGNTAKASFFFDDFTDSATASNWTAASGGDAWDINSTNATYLTVTTINGTTNACVLSAGQNQGPSTVATALFTLPIGTTTGEAGIVFGYTSASDYWLYVHDLASQQDRVYQVSGGTKTQQASWSAATLTPGVAYRLTLSNARKMVLEGLTLTNGFPTGKYGLYTSVVNTKFDRIKVYDDAAVPNATGRWLASGTQSITGSGLQMVAGAANWLNPYYVQGLRVSRFEATFAITRDSGSSSAEIRFAFNGTDQDDFDCVSVTHQASVPIPAGFAYIDGDKGVGVTTTTSAATGVTLASNTSPLWARIINDGTTVSVKLRSSASAPTETDWTNTSACYTSTNFVNSGGLVGFTASSVGTGYVTQVTIKADRDANGSYETTEHFDNFALTSNYAVLGPTYDAMGNLTYDGVFKYTYDAWNRLMTVSKAYRDSGGTLQTGSTITTNTYDGMGRRITKAVANCTTLDATYHYFYDNLATVIEERNGSNQTIKQHTWGCQYIDEPVQVAVNKNPSSNNDCMESGDDQYWLCMGTNTMVLGAVSKTGVITERYSYTAYGQRTAFFSSGTNDPGCYAPTFGSRKVVISSVNQPYGINEIGHQGLLHDEESGLVNNRARTLSASLGRFLQRELLKYIDGTDLYEYTRSNTTKYVDPSGLYVQPRMLGPEDPDPRNKLRCRPDPYYDPGPWNDPSRIWDNNCYNYARDRFFDPASNNHYWQPGTTNGFGPFIEGPGGDMDCAGMNARLAADGAKSPKSNGKCPCGYHKIKVWVDPGNDFHFYRQDNDGSWSDKPGETPAKPVTDPNKYVNDGVSYQNCGDKCVPN